MRRPSGALWRHRDLLKLWTGQVGGIGNTLAILPIALSSVLKVREMPDPVQEPTPAQAELEGGLLEPHPLPSPATADA